VHTVLSDHAIGRETSRPEGEVESHSGLRIANRQIRPSRWADMMHGKRYTTFDRLSSLSTQEDGSKDVVVIGVVYEKSLKKTGSNGNQFVHWSFTDLNFPQPGLMTLFLYGQAFESWDNGLEAPIANGTIFAVLNPVPLPNRGSGEAKDQRLAAKISFGTQLVRLGTCPSLGYCKCTTKVGLPCTMPCDNERGPPVCFWHSLSQTAQKANQWKRQAAGNTAASAQRADGIFVLEPPRQTTNAAQSQGSQRPAAPAQTSSLNAVRSKPKTDSIDKMTQRLLGPASGSSSSKAPTSNEVLGTARGSASDNGGARPPASPARVGTNGLTPPTGQIKQLTERKTIVDRAAADAVLAEGAAMRQIQSLYPQGIPEPDPNNPLGNLPDRPANHIAAVAIAQRCNAGGLSASARLLSKPQSQQRGWERQQPKSQASSTGSSSTSAPVLLVSSDCKKVEKRRNEDADEALRFKKKMTSAEKNRKRLEAEYGPRIAAQLDVADPRKDLVRQQGSRFKDVVEQERNAQLLRRLSELESQDAIAEKMEAIKSITVQAWRCVQCGVTTESHQAKTLCEEEGHVVNSVSAQKTHWQCGNCSLSVYVLDREIPKDCGRCNAFQWKQIPLRKTAKVAMDRDLLLARGEELPFLNSIPGSHTFKRVREAADDYEGL